MLLRKLAQLLKMSPQNVYKSYANVVYRKLAFIARTTPHFVKLFEEAENIVKNDLISSMLNLPSSNNKYRNLFSLPVRDGGPSLLAAKYRSNEYQRSHVCEPLFDSRAANPVMQAATSLRETNKELIKLRLIL